MTTATLFDPGLQPERTLLAWRRTNLSLVLAGLIGLRLLPEVSGGVSLWPPLAVLAAALLLHAIAERRSRHTRTELLAGRPVPRAGVLMLAVAVLVASCALGSAWWVVGSAIDSTDHVHVRPDG